MSPWRNPTSIFVTFPSRQCTSVAASRKLSGRTLCPDDRVRVMTRGTTSGWSLSISLRTSLSSESPGAVELPALILLAPNGGGDLHPSVFFKPAHLVDG